MNSNDVNTKKENNNISKLIIFILLITMICMVLVSGTYARYVSTASGSATARVAKWVFNVNDTDIATSNTVEFKLFDTILDTDGSAETDVVKGLIAPGTKGEFTLNLTNASEVKAQYEINYTVTNDNSVPIKYSVDGGTNWTTDLADIVAGDATTLEAGASAAPITIQWEWAFEGNEAKDNELGNLARTTAPTVTVAAEITASQYVEP